MRLIPLSEAGRPTEPLPDLSKEALEVGEAYVGLYNSVGYQPPWLGYLAMMNDVCVGSCGFKSPPKDGRVEIAYFTFPAHEGKGIATQMAGRLVEMSVNSLSNPPGKGVLIQSTSDPTLFYSFVPWKSMEAVEAMRNDHHAREGIKRLERLCTQATPGAFHVVAELP